MIPSEIHFILAAIRINNMGPIRIRRCVEHCKTFKNLFAASPAELQYLGLTPEQIQAIKNPDWKSVEDDLQWAEQENCHIIDQWNSQYPQCLKEISSAPLLLFVKGDQNVLNNPQFAIVGSRNPTRGGQETAEEFAYTLTQHGLTITSGLALGIDAASHRGAVRVGQTIAVCGSGLNHIYPPNHRQLACKIMENGAIVSEFPPSVKAHAKHFPMRNRLISGLSKGVLVVEAATKSGSLITAQFALDQGREVFAIPGSIHNPLAKGCHQLIRQGAKLVETAGDILEELGFLRTMEVINRVKTEDLDDQHQFLLKQIGYEITSLDAIILRSGLTAGEVSSMLLLLELKGYVTKSSGGYVRQP